MIKIKNSSLHVITNQCRFPTYNCIEFLWQINVINELKEGNKSNIYVIRIKEGWVNIERLRGVLPFHDRRKGFDVWTSPSSSIWEAADEDLTDCWWCWKWRVSAICNTSNFMKKDDAISTPINERIGACWEYYCSRSNCRSHFWRVLAVSMSANQNLSQITVVVVVTRICQKSGLVGSDTSNLKK